MEFYHSESEIGCTRHSFPLLGCYSNLHEIYTVLNHRFDKNLNETTHLGQDIGQDIVKYFV